MNTHVFWINMNQHPRPYVKQWLHVKTLTSPIYATKGTTLSWGHTSMQTLT